ncbi:hypothetical protein [Rhizobium leguminosarum]|uniref:hypothetical protein n=1 Tax=Rhizobium leguminosarum TaxID=384 RepID=UPI001C9154B3|nr:hypothetical protein [Rhizobium leguminosarum]MBY2969298.1 hypothetical protein [Rhizobium leguminosarum]
MASFDRAERAAGHVTGYELDVIHFSPDSRPGARHYARDMVSEGHGIACGETEFGGEVNSSPSSAKQRAWKSSSVGGLDGGVSGHGGDPRCQ